MALSRHKALAFLRSQTLGALATTAENGAPEVALVDYAVSDDLELVFQTIQTTRKCMNLRADPRVAFVCWEGDQTLQYEGVADEPDEYVMKPLLDIFFKSIPEALNQRGWPGLTYFRVRPTWLRLSRYGAGWSVEELSLPR